MMPRYSPQEPPDGFLVAPSKDGFLVLKRQGSPSESATWEQVDGPFAERWYAVKKAEFAYWRAGVFQVITTALVILRHNNKLSPVEYNREMERLKSYVVFKNDKD